MEYYIVVNQPALVRPHPVAAGPILNAYPVGTKIPIVSVDSGWYKTLSGTYIFETKQNMMKFSEWKQLHKDEYIETLSTNENIPKPLRISLQKRDGAIEVGDHVRLGNKDATDVFSGVKLPSEDYKEDTEFVVSAVNGSNITFHDAITGLDWTVKASDLKVKYEDEESGEHEWKDASDVATAEEEESKGIFDTISDIIRGEDEYSKNIITSVANLDVQHIRSVYGMPYQFLPIADNRINSTNPTTSLEKFGRKFAEKIATRAPILILQAGVPNFMKGWSDDVKSSIIASLVNASHTLGITEETAEQIINTPGKYYSIKLVPGQYFSAVNQMTHAIAKLLRIEDVEWNVNGVKGTLGSINWMDASEKSAFGYYGGSVPFYVNSEPQVSEGISNQTTQSQLLAKMNDIGRLGSELQFLLGGASAHLGTELKIPGANTEELANKRLDTTDVGAGGIMDSIIDNFQTAIAGGRFIFPDLWSDSQFMRSYNVTVKLDSPDCDPVSIFINIFVPLVHLLAFCLPRSVGMNNYISPFLVRAYYKSMFHVNMGMITECQITKGDVGAWTQQGLPTQVIVQFTIKDLYNLITLATGWANNSITGNPGQLDYIANMCGVNIDVPDTPRAFKLWWAINGPGAILGDIESTFSGLLTTVYQTIMNKLESVVIPSSKYQ